MEKPRWFGHLVLTDRARWAEKICQVRTILSTKKRKQKTLWYNYSGNINGTGKYKIIDENMRKTFIYTLKHI